MEQRFDIELLYSTFYILHLGHNICTRWYWDYPTYEF